MTNPSQQPILAGAPAPRGMRYGVVPNASAAPTPAARRLVYALGWFSIGLGLAEAITPTMFGWAIGLRRPRRAWLRILGLREIASGVGVLSQRTRAGALRARAGGNVIDLALLIAASRLKKSRRARLAVAGTAVLAVAALDAAASRAIRRNTGVGGGAVRFMTSIAVQRPIEEMFLFWRDLENLPTVLRHLESARHTAERRTHWKARAGSRAALEWDTELIVDAPNEKIVWSSVAGADVLNEGMIAFEALPAGHGTLIRLDLQYRPTHAKLARRLARVFGNSPARELHEDLRRFKQRVETGEVATTAGQPAGRRGMLSRHLP